MPSKRKPQPTQSGKGSKTMLNFATCRIAICASALFALAGCQTTSAPACSGFRLNSLSPAGTVALIRADRAGAERVEGNDANFQRLGCG